MKINAKGMTYLALLFFLVGCQTHLFEEEEEENLHKNLMFKTDTKALQDRKNYFNESDKIGLFAFKNKESSTKNESTPYFLNKHLRYNVLSSTLESDEDIVIETDRGKSQHYLFFAYYPYHPQNAEKSIDVIQTSVLPNQNSAIALHASDFIVAKEPVSDFSKPITLQFKRKFAKLNLNLLSEENEPLNLDANEIHISMNGLFQTADYNIENDEFVHLGDNSKSIQWHIATSDEGFFSSAEMIFIPQDISSKNQTVTIEYLGHLYNCNLPDISSIESGKVYKVDLIFNYITDTFVSKFNVEVEDWEEDEESRKADVTNTMTTIDVSSLNFTSSQVYSVKDGATPIAYLCNEYLLNDEINTKAKVIYPVVDGKADLTDGTIIENESGADLSGAKISWNISENNFSVTSTDEEKSKTIFFNDDKQLEFLSLEGENEKTPLPLTVNSTRCYSNEKNIPIVKIGTLFWLTENISITRFTDKSGIPESQGGIYEEMGTSYLNCEDHGIFYRLVDNDLIRFLPKDCSIPTFNDFQQLGDYVRDVDLLKSGEWYTETIDADGNTSEVSEVKDNVLGFNAKANGTPTIKEDKIEWGALVGKSLSYAVTDEDGCLLNNIAILTYKSDAFSLSIKEVEYFYNVRCIIHL